MVDLKCKGCEYFEVKTSQVIEDGELKLDIRLACKVNEKTVRKKARAFEVCAFLIQERGV